MLSCPIHVQKSFFCLPVRFGLVFCTVFALVGGLIASGSVWATAFVVFKNHQVPLLDQIAIYIRASIHVTLVGFSIFGCIAIYQRSRHSMKHFLLLQTTYLILSLLSTAFLLFSLFRAEDGEEVAQCRAPRDGVDEIGVRRSLSDLVCMKAGNLLSMKLTVVAFILFVELFVIYSLILLPSHIEDVEFGKAVKIPEDVESFTSKKPKKRTSSFFSPGTIGTTAAARTRSYDHYPVHA